MVRFSTYRLHQPIKLGPMLPKAQPPAYSSGWRAGLLAAGTAIAFLMLASKATAQTQPCRADLLAAAQRAESPIYAVRRGGAYCDGNIPILFSGGAELVSLTLGPIAFPELDNRLQINRPKGAQPGETVRVRGMDLRPEKSYRLDGIMRPQEGLDIDLGTAVRPLNIAPTQLGVVSWRDQAGLQEYLPVSIGTAQGEAAPVNMAIRVPIPTIKLSKQICDLRTNSCAAQETVAKHLGAGRTQFLVLPRDAAPQRLEVKLTILAAGQSTISTSYIVIIPAIE